MATHKSAIKRNRQSLKRQARNKAKKSDILTLSKKLTSAPQKEKVEIFKLVQKKIDKAARKGVLHWKAAARKVSRLSKAANS